MVCRLKYYQDQIISKLHVIMVLRSIELLQYLGRSSIHWMKYLYYLTFSPTVFSVVVTSVISPSPSTENCPSQTEQDPEFGGATARLEHFDYMRR